MVSLIQKSSRKGMVFSDICGLSRSGMRRTRDFIAMLGQIRKNHVGLTADFVSSI